jgi:poly(3-hydroxybutyrate) depolymerase
MLSLVTDNWSHASRSSWLYRTKPKAKKRRILRNEVGIGLVLTAALLGQTPPPVLEPPPSQALRELEHSSPVSNEVKAQAEKLVAEARPLQASGQTGEARRRLAHAFVLLKGQSWDAKEEYLWSLSLRPEAVAADPARPLVTKIVEDYPASYQPVARLAVRASLLQSGHVARQIGTFASPFKFDAKLGGLRDGVYTLAAELREGDTPLLMLETPVQVVKGIQSGRAELEKTLTRIEGHDGTKASIRYPWVLAETVNSGHRQWTEADFGIPFVPQPVPYDFARGIENSRLLLNALQAGSDPLCQAKGDHERHYWFEEAREMMAYHVYAPLKWDGHSKLPMVLVLHGNTRDQDYYFDRDDHILAKLAEQHGYLVVCPMGFRPNAGWGSAALSRRGTSHESELSEQDALNVLELVRKEYPIDSSRIFLFGHSAGGGGSWYMGEKYAEKWAAIATSAAPTRPENFPFERLKGMPILVCHGDQDDEVPVAVSRNMVQAAKQHGLNPQYLEVPGATHLTVVALVEPKVFDFFDAQLPKNNGKN